MSEKITEYALAYSKNMVPMCLVPWCEKDALAPIDFDGGEKFSHWEKFILAKSIDREKIFLDELSKRWPCESEYECFIWNSLLTKNKELQFTNTLRWLKEKLGFRDE